MHITPDADKTVLEQIRTAEKVLPGLEIKNSEGYPLYTQTGFLIATDALTNTRSVFIREIKKLEEGCRDDERAARKIIDNHLKKYQVAIESHVGLLKEEQIRKEDVYWQINAINTEIGDWKKKQYNLIEKKKKILDEIADAKKDLLGKCIKETGARIKEISTLNKELVTEKQSSALAWYRQHIDQNNAIKADLEASKTYLQQQQNAVQGRMVQLGKEGVTKLSANFLVTFGHLAILACGLIFSVFTLKTAFDSEDAFSYLLDALLKRTGMMGGTTYQRIISLAAVLGIVTAVSVICRSLLIHIKKRQSAGGQRDRDEHLLKLRIQNDSFYYSGKIRAANWIMFLLRIIPIIFLVGILFIVLGNRTGLSPELTQSMTGMLIGSCMAAAVSGVIYIYVIKVIEPRLTTATNTGPSVLKGLLRHRELFAALAIFLAAILGILIRSAYFAYDNSGSLSKAIFIFLSLSLFLSIVFLAGLSIGYGILFKSLAALNEELQQKIHYYTALIAQYSGPERMDENEYTIRQLDDLVTQLTEHVKRKNNRIFNDDLRLHRTLSYFETNHDNKGDKKSPATVYANTMRFLYFIRYIILAVRDFVLNLLLPHEKDNHRKKQSSLSSLMRGYFLRWEKEYFADLFGKLEACHYEINEYGNIIEKLEARKKELENEFLAPLKPIYDAIERINNKIQQFKTEINYANLCLEQGLAAINMKYIQAKNYLSEGYQLGIGFQTNIDFVLVSGSASSQKNGSAGFSQQVTGNGHTKSQI